MNKTVAEAEALVKALAPQVQGLIKTDVAVCPPFTALAAVQDCLGGSAISLGAQNCFWASSGAYTGEIAPSQLKELGCTYVILGHSERRQVIGEDDQLINKKVKAVLEAGMTPILCVGETLAEREQGQTESIVTRQVAEGLCGLSGGQVASLVVAYEPIWAIGTGRSSSSDDANQVIHAIRQEISRQFNADSEDQVRILYGGSVKASNIAEYIGQPEVDGALVGGASLDANDFAKIAKEADQVACQ
ncbi:MAG: triose-phosphate isomerase [Bacillota bacterium]